jgi:hypothetical protein
MVSATAPAAADIRKVFVSFISVPWYWLEVICFRAVQACAGDCLDASLASIGPEKKYIPKIVQFP